MHTIFAGPWAPAAWGAYYASLYPSSKPADFDAYKAALVANLKEPGRMAALQAMMRVDRSDVEPRLGDGPRPDARGHGKQGPGLRRARRRKPQTLAGLLHGSVAMIDGAGHYPHAEMPEKTAPVDPRLPRRTAKR